MISGVYTSFGPAECQREVADVYFRFKKALAACRSYAKMNDKAFRSSIRYAPDTLYRYPSLDRSACSPSRPITHFDGLRANPRVKAVAIGYHGIVARISGVSRAIVALARTTTIGREQCKRFRSFLQQWQYSVWQVASTMTQSAQSQAQVRGLSPRNCLALTAQVRWSSVPPQVCSATTRAFAANLSNHAPSGAQHPETVVGVNAPGAVFCFGDER